MLYSGAIEIEGNWQHFAKLGVVEIPDFEVFVAVVMGRGVPLPLEGRFCHFGV